MSNFSYVIDSTFQPFSMQEMLVPFTAYKDSFEKTEEAYNDLSDKSDKFKYLSETLPEGSKARDIYEGYANNLKAQAEDLAHNGLTMGNNRALTSLKRRYQGEIGRLVKADEAMAEEKKLRQAMGAQDSSRLYATDNLNIDDFLDGKSPNLYSISGKEAYSRGAAAGKAFSSRVVNVGEGNITLGGYYRDLVAKYGYSPEVLNNFMSNMDAIPELKASFENYMESSGANANLSGANKQRFAKEYLSGVLDGAVYQENHSPQRDFGVLTKAEQVADTRAQQAQAITMWQNGVKWDKEGNVVADIDNINYKTKKIAADAAQVQFNTMYIEDPNNEGSYILNPDYASGYSLDPNGNWKRDPTSNNQVKAEINRDGAIATAVEKGRTNKNKGFDINYKTPTGVVSKHYNYIGAVHNHKGRWYRGNIGEDAPGTFMGLTASNVVNGWGNYTAQASNKRQLSEGEVTRLLAINRGEGEIYDDLDPLAKAITNQIMHSDSPIIKQAVEKAKSNPDLKGQVLTISDLELPEDADLQIFEVPNETGSRKGYLIAVAE